MTLGDFTWTSAGAWASFAALLGIIIRQIGPWRTQSIAAEQSFREGLVKRIEKLEETLERERTERTTERERIETDRKIAQARHDAERALDRHRINNLQACFDAMTMMLKASPEKTSEIISYIEDLRAEQLRAEAIEKAAIHSATIINAEAQL